MERLYERRIRRERLRVSRDTRSPAVDEAQLAAGSWMEGEEQYVLRYAKPMSTKPDGFARSTQTDSTEKKRCNQIFSALCRLTQSSLSRRKRKQPDVQMRVVEQARAQPQPSIQPANELSETEDEIPTPASKAAKSETVRSVACSAQVDEYETEDEPVVRLTVPAHANPSELSETEDEEVYYARKRACMEMKEKLATESLLAILSSSSDSSVASSSSTSSPVQSALLQTSPSSSPSLVSLSISTVSESASSTVPSPVESDLVIDHLSAVTTPSAPWSSGRLEHAPILALDSAIGTTTHALLRSGVAPDRLYIVNYDASAIANLQAKYAAKYPGIHFIHAPLAEFLRSTSVSEFAAMWLDFNGTPFTPGSLTECVKIVFRRNLLPPGGYLLYTICKRMGMGAARAPPVQYGGALGKIGASGFTNSSVYTLHATLNVEAILNGRVLLPLPHLCGDYRSMHFAACQIIDPQGRVLLETPTWMKFIDQVRQLHSEESEQAAYDVAELVGHEWRNGQIVYHVRWQLYETATWDERGFLRAPVKKENEFSWEPRAHMYPQIPEMCAEYDQKNGLLLYPMLSK